MIADLNEYGLGRKGANQSTPMVSFLGRQTIHSIHMLSNRNLN
jgi:hypothetical protein